MESRRRFRQYKGFKSSGIHQNSQSFKSNHDIKSKYHYFKTPKTQAHSFRKKKDTIKPLLATKIVSEFSNQSQYLPEEAEEEERKKKLSDTANKLLNKIKTWSAEVSISGNSGCSSEGCTKDALCDKDNTFRLHDSDISKQELNSNEVDKEIKPKRIAHTISKINLNNSKKGKIKKRKKLTNFPKTKKYNVNEETVKDFQNRIQHKLINDIMQMPKETLQNTINNPSINPIMQLKMSRLVKENKLLIAQKLRTMAESKMESKGYQPNSQLWVDIDKLIDPVLETDLSVLPYELIKQMENIFQVQFNYPNNESFQDNDASNNNAEEIEHFTSTLPNFCANEDTLNNISKCSGNGETDENEVGTILSKDTDETNPHSYNFKDESIVNKKNFCEIGMTHFSDQNTMEIEDSSQTLKSTESLTRISYGEDLAIYDCSTDEDEEILEKPVYSGEKILHKDNLEASKFELCMRKDISQNDISSKTNFTEDNLSYLVLNDKPNFSPHFSSCLLSNNETGSNSENSSNKFQTLSGNQMNYFQIKCNNCQTEKKFVSKNTQTLLSSKDSETQKFEAFNGLSTLYGVPLPMKSTDDSSTSLLQEVHSIQNLVNKLNERRFMIFLQLAKADPNESFLNDSFTGVNFTESLSNGSVYFMELLKNFFSYYNSSRSECWNQNGNLKKSRNWSRKKKKKILQTKLQ